MQLAQRPEPGFRAGALKTWWSWEGGVGEGLTWPAAGFNLASNGFLLRNCRAAIGSSNNRHGTDEPGRQCHFPLNLETATFGLLQTYAPPPRPPPLTIDTYGFTMDTPAGLCVSITGGSSRGGGRPAGFGSRRRLSPP